MSTTNTVDMVHLRQWIGRQTVSSDVLSVGHARLLAATLGVSQDAIHAGAPLPPLWHWIYFLEGRPADELGRDGHPARGGFLPPVPLPNRMWAGGKVRFISPLPLGAEVQKRSTIQSVEHKHGRTGELVFVTVLHEILHHNQVALSETHDIVYKTATPPPVPSAGAPLLTMHPPAPHTQAFVPTSTTLFRYSALTFNGHRIHYDVDYCRDIEGYDNLVVHGPLSATVLASFAQAVASKPIKAFHYKGLRASVVGQNLTVNAAKVGDGMNLWVALPNGDTSMSAHAFF